MSTPLWLASTTPMTSDSRSRFEGIREEFEIIGVVDISSGDEMPFNLRPEHFMAPLGEASTDSADRQTWPVTGGASMQVGPLAEGASPQAEPVTGSVDVQAGPVTSGTSVQAGPVTGSTDPPAEPVADNTEPQERSVAGSTEIQTGPVTRSASPQTGPVILRTTLLSEFTMVVKKNAVDHVKRSMEELLAARHGSQLSLMFTEPYIPSTSGVDKTFGMFLGGFALVGLIVSSIGILSIMMVSVVERTREIGLRREIGASRYEVVFEIVAEAGMLAAAGALIGLVAAWFAAKPLAALMSISSAVAPPESLTRIGLAPAAASVLISVAIGLLAGLYPAIRRQATSVDALRTSLMNRL